MTTEASLISRSPFYYHKAAFETPGYGAHPRTPPYFYALTTFSYFRLGFTHFLAFARVSLIVILRPPIIITIFIFISLGNAVFLVRIYRYHHAFGVEGNSVTCPAAKRNTTHRMRRKSRLLYFFFLFFFGPSLLDFGYSGGIWTLGTTMDSGMGRQFTHLGKENSFFCCADYIFWSSWNIGFGKDLSSHSYREIHPHWIWFWAG